MRWKIEQSLGTKLEDAARLRFAARAEMKANKHWVVILDVLTDGTSGVPQQRELEAATCDEVAQAARVAIALALGANLSSSDADRTSAIAPKPEALPEPMVAPPTQAFRVEKTKKRAPETARHGWFAAQLSPVLDIGSLPGVAPGVRVSALGGYRSVGVQLGGLVLPDRTKPAAGEPSGTFTLVAGTVSVCGVSLVAAGRVRMCAGSELGQLSGRGYNATRTWTGSSGWVAPFVELSGSWPLWDESLRLFGAGTLALPLIRKQFMVENYGQVHQPGTITGRLNAGLELLWQ